MKKVNDRITWPKVVTLLVGLLGGALALGIQWGELKATVSNHYSTTQREISGIKDRLTRLEDRIDRRLFPAVPP